jgi:outer membrane lipoprotein-sorting protein
MKLQRGPVISTSSVVARSIGIAIFVAMVCLVLPPGASAQDDILTPDQSSAKAQKILQQAIAGLGGPAYLNVKDITLEAHFSQFDHGGESHGTVKILDIAIPPDKDRTENLPKRNIIEVRDGSKGWSLDRGGVSEATVTDIATSQEDTAKDIDNILRNRIHEKGMIFRYGGSDVVDYQECDWVELVDSDNRTFRIAISRSTHLPIRKVVDTRDANTRMRTEETEFYSNYHPIAGVQSPFQITRERNGMKIYQAFIDKYDYNTGVPPSLFTKESLDERWEKVGKKEKKTKDKPADKGNDKN